MSGAFRKIDIDIYDEEVLLETELYNPDPRDAQTALRDAQGRSGQVRTLISKGDLPGALGSILEEPPYGTDATDAKNLTLNSVLLILNSTKSADIPGIVRTLSLDAQDTLMKYIYKGMMGVQGMTDVNQSVLLAWHEKLTEVAGIGCIVRVMTDRRTV